MRKRLFSKPTLQAGTVAAFLACGQPVAAEDAVTVDSLHRVIELQQAQLEAQQAQLDAQRKALDKLQAQVRAVSKQKIAPSPALPTSNAVARSSTQQSAALSTHSASAPASPPRKVETQQPPPLRVARHSSPPPEDQRGVGGLSNKNRHDLRSPTGSNVGYSKDAITVEIPEAKTEVSVHGFAEMQVIFDTNGSNNNEFDVFLIPTIPAGFQTKFSVNPSRLGVRSETKLGFGRINTLIATDFNGDLAEPKPRLREAYGEFIHDVYDFSFLTGQTYSNMLDLKSVPETLDFAGPSGYWARRQPLVRFSKLFDHRFRLDISAETPENAVYFNGDIKTHLPDFSLAGAYHFDGDFVEHIRLIGLARDLRATETATGLSDQTIGWALGLSSKINLPLLGEKDNFKFGVQYGSGFGGQLKSGPFDAAFDPETGKLKTLGVFSAYGGLQHWWTDTVRSNAVFGYVNVDNPAFVDGELMDNNTYLAANLIWNPYPFWTLGAEYLHGRRENIDRTTGVANRILGHSKFDF